MSARDQLFLDLFTTAMEGGIGYWSSCSTYHWEKPGGGDDLHGFYAEIDVDEAGDDGEDVPRRIDRGVIQRGWNLAITSWADRILWSSGDTPYAGESYPYHDTWDFDAGDADAIVQLGLFGEVVYG